MNAVQLCRFWFDSICTGRNVSVSANSQQKYWMISFAVSPHLFENCKIAWYVLRYRQTIFTVIKLNSKFQFILKCSEFSKVHQNTTWTYLGETDIPALMSTFEVTLLFHANIGKQLFLNVKK